MKKSNISKALIAALAAIAVMLFSACGNDNEEVFGAIDPPDGQAAAEAPGGQAGGEDGLAGDGLSGEQAGAEEGLSGGDCPPGAFPFAFAAEDLYGNPVTEKSLGEKRLFFVHYWATWCPPCVGEMPELAEIAVGYSGEVGFFALLDDYTSNADGAVTIAQSAGVPDSFIMVDAGAPGLEGLRSMLDSGYVPTTVLIGPDGGMLGSQLIGSYGKKYADVLDEYLGQG